VVTDPFHAAGALPGLDGLDQVERVRRGVWILASTPRPPVGTTPHHEVHRQDKLVLRHYPPRSPTPGPPLVLVPSLINKAWILDLEPDRSLVASLSAAGHPVYLVDWGIPGPEDAQEDVGYVLLELLHRAVDRAVRHARRYGSSRRAALLGYCMGGTLAAMYTALRPERVAGLMALAAPVLFAEGGRFRELVDPAVFDVERSLDPDDLVPVEVMRPAFRLLDPMGNWTKFLALEAASHDPRRLVRALVRERWLEENVPLPGAFAREFIACAYQEDRLLAGTWTVRGEAVDLARIHCPTRVVACERDFITPPPSALPLAQAVSGPARAEVLPTGHIGVVVGSFGPRAFYPLVDHWLREELS